MSPLKINILLHIYAIAEPLDLRGQAHHSALDEFLKNNLIEKITAAPGYRVTDRGLAMVEALLAVQLPICKWIQPPSKEPHNVL